MSRSHHPIVFILVVAAILLASCLAYATLWGTVGDVADMIKSDGDRFNRDLEKIGQDYRLGAVRQQDRAHPETQNGTVLIWVMPQ